MSRPIQLLLFDVTQAGYQALKKTVLEIQSRMSVDGQPIRYPVQWDSQRQRKAFFATEGFGKGIPTQRTGGYRQGWKVQPLQFGYKLENRHPAGAIGGLTSGWQSRIHRGRWPYLLQVLFEELSKLPTHLSNALKVMGR